MIKKIKCKYLTMSLQLRATVWFVICSFMQKGISIIMTPVFTRIMSAAEFGQYNVFNSWLGILTVFISLQLCQGMYTQGLIKYQEESKIYASSLQGLSLTLCVGWTFIYFISRDFWNRCFDLTTMQMFAMLVMIWSTAAFGFWAAEKRVEYKYRNLVFITLLIAILKPTVSVFFILHSQDKVTARILGLAIVEFSVYVFLFFSQMRRGKVFFNVKFWKNALLLNISLIPHYLSATVLNGADRIMIKYMVSESSAGIYSLAYSISQVMTLFNTSLNHAISPWFFSKIKNREIKDLAKVAYLSLIIIATINILLIAFAPEIVKIFAPPEYYDAIWIIPPIAMSVYFTFAYNLFAYFEFFYEHSLSIAKATTIAALANLFLNYIFIRYFGYYAAGYTTLICYIAYTAFHFVNMQRICIREFNGERPYNIETILIITGLFLIVGFGLLFFYRFMWLRYSVFVIVAIGMIVKHKTVLNLFCLLSNKK